MVDRIGLLALAIAAGLFACTLPAADGDQRAARPARADARSPAAPDDEDGAPQTETPGGDHVLEVGETLP